MLDLLGQGVLAIVSGGATGLLGVAFQRFFDWLKVKQETEQLQMKLAHEREMRQIDAQIVDKEWAGRLQVAQQEADAAKDVAESQAFAASMFREPERYSDPAKAGPIASFFLVLLDVVRGIVRPGLTLYLAWVATALYEKSQALMAILDLQEDTAAVLGLHKQIVLTLLYLFTTCVLWWFGTRNKQRPPATA